jgi:hypothetical protein
MSHRCHLRTLLLLLTLSASATWAQTAAEPAATARPLNLSLPRDAVWSSTVRSGPVAAERSHGDASGLPDFAGTNGGQGQRGRMPYGSGYEARQRDASGGGSGRSGGGRGMGRGR